MTAEPTLLGKHYETGTIVNALHVAGHVDPHTKKPYSEALALGASGGIAFGNFIFEYKGHLPHVAILIRNTFAPFERTLDNLAIRRERFETIHRDKGDENLKRELDLGHTVIAWADVFSLSFSGLKASSQMWQMNPYFVLGYDRDSVRITTSSSSPTVVDAKEFLEARGVVKKDRYRIITLSEPDVERIPGGIIEGIKTCVSLFLDKPPAGSANNFGLTGLAHWSKSLRDTKNAQCWARRFAPGPNMVQALAGGIGQPGIWDWIETWGTSAGADRFAYANFLVEAAIWTNLPELAKIAKLSESSGALWQKLADQALTDEIAEFKELKHLKRSMSDLRRNGTIEERQAIQTSICEKIKAIAESPERLATVQNDVFHGMADIVDEIAKHEGELMRELRRMVGV
jgi:hypothetical protein